ncbi:MAG TPA: hypothetical protein VNQ79_22850 [Blastocatellia bacterium]|nr:hypothetical protein [Blastocatellia bacterium]
MKALLKSKLPKARLARLLLLLALADLLYGLTTMMLFFAEKLTLHTTVTGETLEVDVPFQWRTMGRPFVFAVLWLAWAAASAGRRGVIASAMIALLSLGLYYDCRDGFRHLYQAYQSGSSAGAFLFAFYGVNEWDVVRGVMLALVIMIWLLSLIRHGLKPNQKSPVEA